MLQRWKRWLIIMGTLLGLVAAYALFGFVALPKLIQAVVLPKVSANLAGSVKTSEVRFNPFSLTLKTRQLVLADAAGIELASIGEAVIDLQGWNSLTRKALIASADIAAPRVLVAIDKDGKLNFSQLVPPSSQEEKPSTSVFPFLIESLNLSQGTVSLQDRANGRTIDVQWAPVDLQLSKIGSAASEPGSYRLTLASPQAGKLEAQGNLVLFPFSLKSDLALNDLNLAHFATYLSLPAAYQLTSATGSLKGHIQGGAAGDAPDWTVDGTSVELKRIGVNQDGKPLAQIDSISLTGLGYRLSQQQVLAASLAVKGFDLGKAPAPAASEPEQTPTPNDPAKAAPRKPAVPESGNPRLGSLRVDKIDAGIAARTVHVGAVELQGAFVKAERSKEGQVAVAGLPVPAKPSDAPASAAAPPAAEQAKAPSWTAKIGEIVLKDSAIRLEDQSVPQTVSLPIRFNQVSAKEVTTDLTKPIATSLDAVVGENGQVRVSGNVVPKPFSAVLTADVAKIDLSVLQPYLQDTTKIVLLRGDASVRGDVHVNEKAPGAVNFTGSASIEDMITEDRREHREFLSWKRVDVNEIVFDQPPSRLSIREIVMTEPYGRVQIEADRRLNLIDNLEPPGSVRKTAPQKAQGKGEPARKGPAEESTIVIGNLKIVKGRSDFTDLTLKPAPFHSDIEDLEGNIRGLSSQKTAKADIKLDGHIDQISPVHISGQLNPFQPKIYSDIVMSFRDLNLTSLSPYSGKFAGYRIEKGKLDMDLQYKLEDNRMVGDNKIVMDHLELGEKVESKEATSLPVRLAIALLKDSNGRIDLRIPVSGDLSSPKVSIGGLIVSAFTQLITKLVSSPVAILGTLVPDGTKDLDAVNFAVGSSQLSPAEKTKLGKIAAGIKAHPGLSLEIAGEADRKTDPAGVAEQELLRQLLAAKRAEKPGEPEPSSLSDQDYRRLFTKLLRDREPKAPEFKGLLGGPSVLEGPGFEQAKKRYLGTVQTDDEALRRLAKSRGEAVRQFLIKEGGLTNQQIYLLDAKIVEAEDKPAGARLSVSG
jgi:hypothetical protein